ncbi:protease HtpX [bacterium]|nr:protease HtpX [bacterium]
MTGMLKTTALLGGLTALFMAAGYALGGESGMATAFAFSIIMNIGSWFFSDKIVLALHRAKEVQEPEFPDLFATVKRLADRARIPMPRIYLIESDTPNAFATGRNPKHAVVAFNRGLIDRLRPEQISAVAAHELAHIKHRDILISSIAACIAGAISMIAHTAQWAMMFGRRDDRDNNPIAVLATLIIIPIAATLIQMAISRSREFEADRLGAIIHGNPLDLASALASLHAINDRAPLALPSPAMAHMYIVSPLSGRNLLRLFSTHPDVNERINRLQQMATARG